MELKAAKAIAKPVTLAEVKANKIFADSPLVRQGRLSVVPLTRRAIQISRRLANFPGTNSVYLALLSLTV